MGTWGTFEQHQSRRFHMCAGKTTNAPVKPHVRCRAHVTFAAHTLFTTAHSVITAFSKESAELKSLAFQDLLELVSEYYSLQKSRL